MRIKNVGLAIVASAVFLAGSTAFIPSVYGCGGAGGGSCKAADQGPTQPEPDSALTRFTEWFRGLFA